MQTIISLRPGMTAAISGTVLNAGLAHTRRPGFKLFAPFASMLIVSIVISLLIWLFRR